MSMTISEKELIEFLVDNNVGLSDVVDAVIETNGIVGVGLVSLAEGVSKYIMEKIKVAA